MAVDNFTYQGINRAVSDYSGAKMCEELINLRPTDGGLVPVKPFKVKLANTPYRRIFVHHTTSGDKYLAVKKGTGTVSVVQITIDDTTGTATEVTELFSIDSIATGKEEDVIEHLYYAAAGNVVLFSIAAPDAVKYENHAFTWKMDSSGVLRYVNTEADDPGVTYTLSDGNSLVSAVEGIPELTLNSSMQDVVSAVENGLNAIQENNPELCLGPVIIATAYKTKDGNTFWTGNWQVYDPMQKIGTTSPPYVDATIITGSQYTDFFTKYGHGYAICNIPSNNSVSEIYAFGTNVTITFPQVSSWDEDESIIQSVEVYCSKPQLYMDVETAYEGFKNDTYGGGYQYGLILAQRSYADMNLGSQLLYHQASIQMSALIKSDQTVNLTFGGNIQITEETLDADAGALERFGRIIAYNARFHYFDSIAKIQIGEPFFLHNGTGTIASSSVFVRYVDADQNVLVNMGNQQVQNPAYLVIAPSLNIKEVMLYLVVDATHRKLTTYRMTESSSYNYTICTTGSYTTQTLNTTDDADLIEYYDALALTSFSGLDNPEPDAINVTEQYNPFVFRVEHSYKAPGNVIDVQPQMAGLTDVSYGRDPLSVFTERGVYALTQGSANVLYGAFLPVSNLIGQRGGVPVEMGIFFLADGALWLLSGRRVTLISDALSLGPHKYIRNCQGYEKLSGVDTAYDPSSTVTSPVYDISPYLSQVEFDTFSKGGRLGYNRFRMELFVSNPSYNYTYVLSLKYRQWFKLSQQIWQDEASSDLANTPGSTAGNMNVVDLANEQAGTILAHMQGRPFSMAYQYAHIHRIVAMMRAKLTSANSEVAVAALYGSEDLQNWKLLAYAKRNGATNPLYISQLRTSSAARSWRYYTICIGGRIPAGGSFHTDIGPVLIDYEPVIRRIG